MKPSLRTLVALTFALSGSPAFAETVEIPLEYFDADSDNRSFFVDVNHPGESWYYDGSAWVSEDVDLGFFGGAHSSLVGDGKYENSLWLFPHNRGLPAVRYYHSSGNYEHSGYSSVDASGYGSGGFSSNYYVSEDGTLLFLSYHKNLETGGYEDYSYTTDWSGNDPSYSYDYYDGEGTYSSNNAPFDTDALLANINAGISATLSHYGIFDFEHSYIDYGNGSGPVSLAEIFKSGLGAYDDSYGGAYFTGGAVDSITWLSDAPINSVFVTYIPTTAVPEPETWGMLLAGLGLMGAVTRRRRRA